MAPKVTPIQAVIKAYETGRDYHLVGECLGMKPRTVNWTIQQYLEKGRVEQQKPGKPHPKWDEEMQNFCISIVERNHTVCFFFGFDKGCFIKFSQATLEDIKFIMREHFGSNKPEVSTTTIARKLDKAMITWKVFHRNSDNKIKKVPL